MNKRIDKLRIRIKNSRLGFGNIDYVDAEVLLAEIGGLTAERDAALAGSRNNADWFEQANADRISLTARNERLVEALKPFDDFAQYLENETDNFTDDDIVSCEYRGDIEIVEFPDLTFGHFRNARRELENNK